MKFRDFQLPRKIKWAEKSDDYGRLVCEPFERGYAHTIGNSMRRVLLASLEGAVITSVNIEGAPHEYASLPGVKEDILEIIFNLKQLRFKLFTEESQRIKLEVSGKESASGADFVLNEAVKLMNPEVHIAELDGSSSLKLEAVVSRGRGYLPASERQGEMDMPGEIPVDAAFSPVSKVNYRVENARVGQATDFDRLILELWTDSSVKPDEAVAYVAQIITQVLDIFQIPEAEEIELGPDEEEAEEAEAEKEFDLGELPLEELKIPTRILNSLRRGGVRSVEDLVTKREKEIMEIEKIGDKSMDEIREKMDEFGKERGVSLEFKN